MSCAGEVNLNHHTPYQVMHNGVKVSLGGYHGKWMEEIISSLRGHHEPQEEKVFYEVLKKIEGGKPIMLELGSYWAYYSLWFKHSFPMGCNYMIEPVESNLLLGKRNFGLNNFSGEFIHGCVGDSFMDQETFVNWEGTKTVMPKYSVDHIVEKFNIPFLDILHSDIQGVEYDMLMGCRKCIENEKIGYFFISTHGETHTKCLDFFKQRELHIIAEHSIADSASADGLVVAQSNRVPFIEGVAVS